MRTAESALSRLTQACQGFVCYAGRAYAAVGDGPVELTRDETDAGMGKARDSSGTSDMQEVVLFGEVLSLAA